jgi:hypothetical protein
VKSQPLETAGRNIFEEEKKMKRNIFCWGLRAVKKSFVVTLLICAASFVEAQSFPEITVSNTLDQSISKVGFDAPASYVSTSFDVDISAGETGDITLPYRLEDVHVYTISALTQDGSVYVKKNIAITDGKTIKFSPDDRKSGARPHSLSGGASGIKADYTMWSGDELFHVIKMTPSATRVRSSEGLVNVRLSPKGRVVKYQVANRDNVRVTAYTYERSRINNRKARWYRIIQNGEPGWIYGAYLEQ